MPKPINATVVDGKIHLKFGYDPDFSNELKANLPRGTLRWNPIKDKQTGLPNPGGDNTWVVDPSALDAVGAIAERMGYEILVATTASAAPMVQVGTSPYERMFGKVPDDLMKKVYQTLSMKLHPDMGGNTATFAEFNSAWDEIKKLRKM